MAAVRGSQAAGDLVSDLRIGILALGVGFATFAVTYVALYELLGWLQHRAEERNLPGLIDEIETWRMEAASEG